MKILINYTDFKDLEDNKNENSIGVIIAHYNEDLDWIDNYFPENFNIYIYSKKNWKPKLKRPFYHEFLNNVGRCDHTYLYHIINFYNNLDEFNIFITGSGYVLRHKKEKMDSIINNLGKYHYFPYSKLDRPNFLNTGDGYDYAYNMKMKLHCAYLKENKNYNIFGIENCKLIPSGYKSLEDFKEKIINKKDINFVTYFGIFSVSKIIILKNSIRIYRNLLAELEKGDNIEAGHFMERLWAHLFLS